MKSLIKLVNRLKSSDLSSGRVSTLLSKYRGNDWERYGESPVFISPRFDVFIKKGGGVTNDNLPYLILDKNTTLHVRK